MLAPVNDRHGHRLGLRQGALLTALVFAIVALIRLLVLR